MHSASLISNHNFYNFRLKLHEASKKKYIFFWGGGTRQGLVEPCDIVLNLVTHILTKELPEGLVPHQNYWGEGARPPIKIIGGASTSPRPRPAALDYF